MWRRKWQTTPVFLPGESHGQRILAGCSPWGCSVGNDWAKRGGMRSWSPIALNMTKEAYEWRLYASWWKDTSPPMKYLKKKKNLEPESEQAFISNYVCVLNRLVMSNSLRPHGLYPTRLLCPGACDSAGKNTGLYLTTVYSSVKGDNLSNGIMGLLNAISKIPNVGNF